MLDHLRIFSLSLQELTSTTEVQEEEMKTSGEKGKIKKRGDVRRKRGRKTGVKTVSTMIRGEVRDPG